MNNEHTHRSLEDIESEIKQLINDGKEVPASLALGIGGIYAGRILFDVMEKIKADNFLHLEMYLPNDPNTRYELLFRKKKGGVIRWIIKKLKLF